MRLVSLCLAACLSFSAFAEDAKETAAMPALAEGVALEVSVAWPDGQHPFLEGRTNLPEGTLLEISLKPAVPASTTAVAVKEGGFSVKLGGDAGLAPGDYSVSASMLLPMSQPKDVVKIIGENGENLKGNTQTEPLTLTVEAAEAAK